MAICGDHGLFTARRFLDKSNVKNYCGDIGKINYGLVISGTISDLITVLLPIPMVSNPFIGTPVLGLLANERRL